MAGDELAKLRQQLAVVRASRDEKNEEANALRAELLVAREAHANFADAKAEIAGLKGQVASLEAALRASEKNVGALERQARSDAELLEAAAALKAAIQSLSK